MHKQSSDASSPNTPPIMVKNEVDVIAYAESNQTEDSEVYYGRSSDWGDSCFNGRRGKINCGGRRHNNNNKTHSTDQKKTKNIKTWRQHHYVLSVAANSTRPMTAPTLTIPKINMGTAKTWVIFPCLTS